jgi:hypothetical protein
VGVLDNLWHSLSDTPEYFIPWPHPSESECYTWTP